jgi:Domain of unknown function (DUF1995)
MTHPTTLTFATPAPLSSTGAVERSSPHARRPRRACLRPLAAPQRQVLPCRISSRASVEGTDEELVDSVSSYLEGTSRVIPGTPCFTGHITASPMPREDRDCYIIAAADAAVACVRDFGAAQSGGDGTGMRPNNVFNLTLQVPQLNPELDVYDRRMLMTLTWAVVTGMVSELGLRTRVLIQGTGRYGAVPLSIAGLRRHLEADMGVSSEAWGGEEAMAAKLGVSEMEDPRGVADEDNCIIVISPTNAAGMPVVEDCMRMVERVGRERPIFLINPRLADVPSAAGVMSTGGRASRIAFLESMENPFYLRLLYDSGTMYPLRGILFHRHGEQWQIWAPEGVESFRKVGTEFATRPNSSQITDALSTDRRERRLATAKSSGIDTVLAENIPATVAAIAIAAAGFAYYTLVLSHALPSMLPSIGSLL